MGISIAEALGSAAENLAELRGTLETDDERDSVESRANGSSCEVNDDDPVTRSLVAALIELGDVPAEDFHPDLRFDEDFNLETIGLYAVVSRVERELGISMPDAQITTCRRYRDLEALARRCHSSR